MNWKREKSIKLLIFKRVNELQEEYMLTKLLGLLLCAVILASCRNVENKAVLDSDMRSETLKQVVSMADMDEEEFKKVSSDITGFYMALVGLLGDMNEILRTEIVENDDGELNSNTLLYWPENKAFSDLKEKAYAVREEIYSYDISEYPPEIENAFYELYQMADTNVDMYEKLSIRLDIKQMEKIYNNFLLNLIDDSWDVNIKIENVLVAYLETHNADTELIENVKEEFKRERSNLRETEQQLFTNEYGTRTTKCAHLGCSEYIASSGDTNCCVIHSNKCLNCNKYIDEDAVYCMDCLTDAVDRIK